MARIKLVYLGGGSTRAADDGVADRERRRLRGLEVVLVDLDEDRLALIARSPRRWRAGAPSPSRRRRTAEPHSRTATRCFRRSDPALRGARARRAHPARPRPHRPGDAGRGRLLHGAARGRGAEGRLRGDGRSSARTRGSSTDEPGEHRRRGDHSPLTGEGRLALEGPIYLRTRSRSRRGLDPERLRVTMVGLNHGCWGVEHDYDGRTRLLLAEAWEQRRDDPTLEPRRRWAPARRDDGVGPGGLFRVLPSPTTSWRSSVPSRRRAEDILGWSGDYWRHYEEQAQSDDPQLDPSLTRRHPRARARDRRDGRDLQRQGRGHP